MKIVKNDKQEQRGFTQTAGFFDGKKIPATGRVVEFDERATNFYCTNSLDAATTLLSLSVIFTR